MNGSRNVTIRNRKFLKTFTGVADMMADDVPQQHPDNIGQAAKVDEGQPQTVALGGGDNEREKTME